MHLPTIPDQTGLWPLDPAVTHLNHGSFGSTPLAGLDHLADLRREVDARPMAWFRDLPSRVRRASTEVAGWLGSDPERTVLVSNASAAATITFRGVRLEPEDEVLVTNHGYGAVTMAAERAARRQGARLVTAEFGLSATADEVVERVRAALTNRTRVLVVDQVTSPTGLRLPVERLCVLAREHGVISVVDGAHAPGMLADPVVADADIWFGNLHKWGCAPRACAALVVGEQAPDLDPVIDSWAAAEPFPHRFDMQGTSDLTAWLAAPWVLAHLEQSIGWDLVRRYQAALLGEGTRLVTEAMSQVFNQDCAVVRPMAAPALSLVRVPGLAGDFAALTSYRALMDDCGFEAAGTGLGGQGYVRLSAAAHNTLGDYERFADVAVPSLGRAFAR
ncbi:aminotransferase class V-fold PLP-dependent enzyme [Aestuariimicrobium ganziense]|uniref:aminotransferase class V-fold PLP-dependent enzyme n=1 Tax=Aestuariimicrobium ganziense TaxID=2773677 RepID=UPI001941B218|nr:aminotransferase class V-fold PLP-dependent enzyme [Aestuariimicrobium ganziense]